MYKLPCIIFDALIAEENAAYKFPAVKFAATDKVSLSFTNSSLMLLMDSSSYNM